MGNCHLWAKGRSRKDCRRVERTQPHLYLEALKRLNTPAEKTILFEDIPLALQTGNSVGLITCAVNCDDEHQDIEKLSELADLTIKHWY